MMMKKRIVLFSILALLILAGFMLSPQGATNFDRLVLGSSNYGTDPNPTADLTLQNGELITNSTDGTISIGSANFTIGNLLSLSATDTTSRIRGVGTLKADTMSISGMGNLIAIKGPDQDTVVQISGYTNNTIYYFQAAYDDSTITFRDGGNLKLSGVVNLDANTDRIYGVFIGGNFIMLGSISND